MPLTRREWTLAAAATAFSCGESTQPEEASTSMSAEQLLAQSLVLDLHCDTPWRRSADPFDLSERYAHGQVDIPKMRDGGVSGVFFVVYNPGARGATPEKFTDAMAIIDSIEADLTKYSDDLQLATTAEQVAAIKSDGRIAVLLGVEGGHMIDSNLDHLRTLFSRGARYMSLTHGVHLPWAGSSGDKSEEDPGLTDFGREVIAEMNRLGMIVDVSHTSDKTFEGVIEAVKAPLIASHSSCRALATHPRNMTDDMIRAVADKGGVVHINFYNAFLDDDYRSRSNAYEREGDPKTPADKWDAAMTKLEKIGRTPFSVLLNHIEHAVNIAGIEHVGLGSDFDGVDEELPEGMEDISKLPNLIPGLRERGFSDDAIENILGRNTLRVMSEVQAHADA